MCRVFTFILFCCVYESFAYMRVCVPHAWPEEEMESFHVVAGNRTWVLSKNSKCS